MTRERKQAVIRKPVIDEEAALRFASAQSEAAPSVQPADAAAVKTKSPPSDDKETVEVAVILTKETHARIIREAAKKKRSVEEMLQRHLTKHYGKE